MNLGIIETHLLAALQRALPGGVALASGPPVAGPATSLRAEVFAHAARFEDFSGVTAEGARIARRPARVDPDVSGFVEERLARIVVEVTCVCATLRQIQELCALVAPPALLALETTPDPLLTALPDGSVSLRFADFAAALHACETTRELHESVPFHRGRLTFHLDGFLHVRVTRRAGLDAAPLSAVPAITVEYDPRGIDLPGEHVMLSNETGETIQLGGCVLQDASTSTHRFVFPERFSLAPGTLVRVWTKRGVDNSQSLYWGSRHAIWNNTGDTAVLLNRTGAEVARFTYTVPQTPGRQRALRPSARARSGRAAKSPVKAGKRRAPRGKRR